MRKIALMNPRRVVEACLYVCFSLSLLFCGIVLGQEEGRAGVGKAPENFEKGERGSFQRKRMEWEYRQRAYPHKRIPSGARLNALKQLDKKLAEESKARIRAGKGASGAQSTAWTMIGPQPEKNGWWGPNSGRVAAVAVDPTNTNIVYAGAAQGGVWKTTDGGVTWTPLTDTQASLAIGSLAIDPQNHLTIYAGTGEENNSGDSYYGVGILKSTDGGVTWTQIPGPFAGGPAGGARIGGLAVHPTNSQVVLAASGCCAPTTSGVYRSTDSGNTWTQVLNVNGSQAYNVVFDPTNGNIAFASVDNNGVYESTNGGSTWTAANGSGSSTLPTGGSTGRVALAMDPNVTTTLYAGITNNGNGGILGTYKTTDGGSTWNKLTNAPNYCGGLCWYANVIAVMPGNSNVIYAGGDGGTPVTNSLDGGNTWTNLNNLGIHPDLHALAFTPDGQKLYIGNDGGMYSTTNPASSMPTIKNLNNRLATLQFYSGPSINPNNANAGFGGTQDNLTNEYIGDLAWQEVDCGDGGNTVIDFTNTNNVYVNCIGMSLDKSTDGGASFHRAMNGIETSDRVNWVPPLIMDPSNAQRLYFGTHRVYQTTNAAGVWAAISPDLTTGDGNSLVALAVAPTDPNTIYAASSDIHLHVTTNALAGGSAVWTDISDSTSLPTRYITAIAGDPSVPTTAYVTFSGFSGYFWDERGHVFMTTDTGASWTDISGDLPNIPVNTIIVDPVAAGTIYVGTDIGAFYTTNTGTSWATLGTGLPRVADYGMAYQASTRTLWVATHGRSMWSLNVAGLDTAVTLTPTSLSFGKQVINTTSVAKTVTLTNTGTAALNISSITISGDFAIFSKTCGSTLAVGAKCKVKVTFTPTVLGKLTGALTFTDNAPNSPQTVALSGTGVLPATLTPAKATYTAQTVGTTSPPKTFTLTNNQTVTLSSIVISTTGDFAVSATTCTTSLGPKSKCTISVTFTPTAKGTRTGVLTVSDSANNSPQQSSLTGKGK
jgi:photosystem II stability/assembly factor-like uncharacterized protein